MRDNFFSFSSAYVLGAGDGDVGIWVVWRQIWRLKIQQRVKSFLWVLDHDKLLTNYERWRRRIADNSDCQQSASQREDVLHAIRDCPGAGEVWDLNLPQQLGEISTLGI